MSEIDATLVKDGQKVVATVSQSGTIISDPSAVDATALVQTDDGPQLCVKTFEMGEGGGGGTVDQTYDATSTNAQSGTAVAEAVAPYLKNTATGTNSLTVLGTATNGSYSLNIGVDTTAQNSYSVAIGTSATTKHNSSGTAIGYNAQVSGSDGVAIGRNAKAALCGTGIGKDADAAMYSVAIGSYGAEASGNTSIAIGGYNAKATAATSIQLGVGTNSTANSFQVFDFQLLDRTTGKIPVERLPVKHRFCTEGRCNIDKSVIPWLSTNQPFVFTFSFRTPPLKNFLNGQAIVITGNTHYDIGFELVMDWEDASETKARLGVGLTTANNTWNLGWSWSEYSLEPLTWYKVRLSYDLTKYTVEYALDNSDSWTTIKEATSSDKLYCNTDIFLTQQGNTTTNAIWKYGEVDINSFKATSGNTTYIDGIYSLRNLITLPANSYQVKEYYEIG